MPSENPAPEKAVSPSGEGLETNRDRIEVLLKQAQARITEAMELMAGMPRKKKGQRTVVSRNVVLNLLNQPGGFWRTAAELADRLEIPARTVSWALKNLVVDGHVSRRSDGRYCAKDSVAYLSKFSGDALVDEMVMNQIVWRWQSTAIKHHQKPTYTGTIADYGATTIAASVGRMVKSGRLQIDPADGRVIRPDEYKEIQYKVREFKSLD